MRAQTLFLIAAVTATAASAEERYKINPLVLDGVWFATQGAPPDGCEGDGWWMTMVGGNVSMMLTVQKRTGQKFSKAVSTQYAYVVPPPGAPAHLDIFLNAYQGDVAVDVHNGSRIDWVPAGKDHAYPQVSLYLRRCPAPPIPQ